jgi:hypothetical protein
MSPDSVSVWWWCVQLHPSSCWNSYEAVEQIPLWGQCTLAGGFGALELSQCNESIMHQRWSWFLLDGGVFVPLRLPWAPA